MTARPASIRLPPPPGVQDGGGGSNPQDQLKPSSQQLDLQPKTGTLNPGPSDLQTNSQTSDRTIDGLEVAQGSSQVETP